eukprot:NODE_707_length_1240_cov_215.776658_g565_i0.p1 GENE.NODE_707_length_1240_cov_215.776658_g565_i0~~NODE_707_length_1240_cov_215.776658_g565_i0.p1  ORF type:complete len:276 (-),score=48.02 NODE_707_length_1240_cov_215.776658_g565_i0:412-1215(-)
MGYIVFCEENRVLLQQSGKASADVERELGLMWKQLDRSKKQFYINKARLVQEQIAELYRTNPEQYAQQYETKKKRPKIAGQTPGSPTTGPSLLPKHVAPQCQLESDSPSLQHAAMRQPQAAQLPPHHQAMAMAKQPQHHSSGVALQRSHTSAGSTVTVQAAQAPPQPSSLHQATQPSQKPHALSAAQQQTHQAMVVPLAQHATPYHSAGLAHTFRSTELAILDARPVVIAIQSARAPPSDAQRLAGLSSCGSAPAVSQAASSCVAVA